MAVSLYSDFILQSKMKSAKAKYYKALKLLDRSLVCETEEEEQRALDLKARPYGGWALQLEVVCDRQF